MPRAAALACLGSPEARARVLEALTSAHARRRRGRGGLPGIPADHRSQGSSHRRERNCPDDGPGRADSRARHAGRQRLSDPQSLEELARLFPAAETLDVQRAIAAVLIRADYRIAAEAGIGAAAEPSPAASLAGGGNDIIDILIRRLQSQ